MLYLVVDMWLLMFCGHNVLDPQDGGATLL